MSVLQLAICSFLLLIQIGPSHSQNSDFPAPHTPTNKVLSIILAWDHRQSFEIVLKEQQV